MIAGQAYEELKKCIVINIMDFNLIYENPHYHSLFRIMEKDRGIELLDDLEIHYLELVKLDESQDINEMDPLEEWLIFIKDAANDKKMELSSLVITSGKSARDSDLFGIYLQSLLIGSGLSHVPR